MSASVHPWQSEGRTWPSGWTVKIDEWGVFGQCPVCRAWFNDRELALEHQAQSHRMLDEPVSCFCCLR